MDIRFADAEELGRWDSRLLDNPDGGNVFQSYEIAKVKELGRWRPRYLIAGDLSITVIEKSVRGIGKLWYVPKGPGVDTIAQLLPLIEPLRQFARKHGVFAVKIEPELLANDTIHQQLTEAGLVKVAPIQPNASTVILDLSPPLDEILKSFNQKGRHALRRAERDGVLTMPVEFNRDNARTMYELLLETAEGRWHAREFNYYYAFWKNFADEHRGQLFFAQYEGQIVAAAFAMYMGHKGTYKDGASIRAKTAYGASHLLQWEVIKWMKDHAVVTYDLCGTPPSDRINDTNHPHYGIGRFKTSFNKHVTDYIGAYDIVVKPMKYKLWTRLGERAALRLSKLRFGESWY